MQFLPEFALPIHRLRMWEGTTRIMDTGRKQDLLMRGGRLGFFSFSQADIIWSDLSVRCLGKHY
jgi:hypothetical protein